MLRAVLDTNVLVAALRSRKGAAFGLLNTLEYGIWRPQVSVALALEYEDVLNRPGTVPALSTKDIEDFLDYLLSRADLVPSVPRLRPTLRDPDDDRILEVAARSRALIVTYNVRDFPAAGAYGIDVMIPAAFLKRLRV